jgi:citronellol/citronellal dehydrogenase
MSMCVLGMAEEFAKDGIAFNALWPKTAIATAAIKMIGGDPMMRHSRKVEIMGDAAYAIFCKPAREHTGNFYIDEDVLRGEGITDFRHYAMDPEVDPMPDFFLD